MFGAMVLGNKGLQDSRHTISECPNRANSVQNRAHYGPEMRECYGKVTGFGWPVYEQACQVRSGEMRDVPTVYSASS